MNLTELLRGPSRCEVELDQEQTVERLPRADLYKPVVKIKIHYQAANLRHTFLFPWQRAQTTTIWLLRVECILTDGRRITNHFASEASLKNALDYGYLKGMEQTLLKLRQSIQADIIEVRA